MSKRKKNRRGRAVVETRKRRLLGDSIRYKCLDCGIEEDIPKSAIEIIDILDEGVGEPTFECKKCKGIMEPVECSNICKFEEVEYKIGDKSFEDDDGDWMF